MAAKYNHSRHIAANNAHGHSIVLRGMSGAQNAIEFVVAMAA